MASLVLSVGEWNDVTLMGLNHKMGWRGTTNTALAFGENGKCQGYLVGEVCDKTQFALDAEWSGHGSKFETRAANI